MRDQILVVGTMDSKGIECTFLRSVLEKIGVPSVVTMDVGVLGEPVCSSDISRELVATAGGTSINELRALGNRQEAIRAMGRGAAALVRASYDSGTLAGVVGIGGSGGTLLAAQAMSSLPIGFPRLIVSTVASLDMRPYVGFQDIMMLQSVADLVGLNRVSRQTLRLGANAIAGMIGAAQEADEPDSQRLTIAITAIGLTTAAAMVAKSYFEEASCEVIVFHATGMGGDAMECLVAEGKIDAVLDLTLVELSDKLFGGAGAAATTRPNLRSGHNIPRVLVPGGLDMVKFGAPSTVPTQLRQRTRYSHSDTVTLLRLDAAQAGQLGSELATLICQASDPIEIVLPLGGLSDIDGRGRIFADEEANQVLFDRLKKLPADRCEIISIDAHINDPRFAREAAERLLRMLEPRRIMKTVGRDA